MKNYYEIGQIFIHNKKYFTPEEHIGCKGCAFDKQRFCSEVICSPLTRTDKASVIFKKVSQ